VPPPTRVARSECRARNAPVARGAENPKFSPASREIFPKAVDGRDRLSGDSFSVDEHDAVDQVLQSLAAVQLSPA
jgi:hypothetical protein